MNSEQIVKCIHGLFVHFAIEEEIDMRNQRNLPNPENKYTGNSYTDRSNKTVSARRGAAVAVLCCVFTLVFISAGILLGVWFGGMEPQNQTEPTTIQTDIEGVVVFSGGVHHRGTDRVNPVNAMPVLDGVSEETNIIRWWIVEIDSVDVLYEGENGGLEHAFASLCELGKYGEYKLYFRLEETDSKKTHLLGGNFFIKDIKHLLGNTIGPRVKT